MSVDASSCLIPLVVAKWRRPPCGRRTPALLLRSNLLRREILQRVALDGALAFSVDEVLDAKEAVATGLEDAADLEGQGNLGRGGEEPENLHGVASDPAGEHGQTEALARLGLRVGEDLRDRERGFDGEANVADEDRVRGIDGRHARHDNFADEQACEEVDNELPVSDYTVSLAILWFDHCQYLQLVRLNGFGDLHCQKLYGL